jgi:aminopeptidase-like protein
MNNTNDIKKLISQQMYSWAVDLFPLCRSLTGKGTLETLEYLQNLVPQLKILSVSSGTKVYDWEIPDEWNIEEAWIADENGNKLIDFKSNNLHVMNYSAPLDKRVNLAELNKHLHSLPELPDAIPYKTSYYKRDWGFCLTHNQRVKLKPGNYHVYIKSDFNPNGKMNYGEIKIPGREKSEIFLSTYVCHPSMANNELSGPIVTLALAKWILDMQDRRYSYRIVFIPETIGAINYIFENYNELKINVKAGFIVTCVGDDRAYSYMPSKMGNTLADKVAKHVLFHTSSNFKSYTWFDRGSDERQYCSPGINLPMVSIMRSKYGEYPEYHTSLDNLNLISPEGLLGGYEAIQSAISLLEQNYYPVATIVGEPMMSKRGLRSTIGGSKGLPPETKLIGDVMSLCDGTLSILDIAEMMNMSFQKIYQICDLLKRNELIDVFYEDE